MSPFSSSTARARLVACLFVSVLVTALPARAWKPITHVYLAEKARAELMAQNGAISLHRTDFTARQQTSLIGTYTVSTPIYQALRDYPAYFRAGVLGPDAYPDLLFGQSVIHPATEDQGSDSEPWLRHLYNRASTPQERAFVMGFLSHGAGDMFAHTFVNHYAQGPFAFANGNAARHILTEGYVGRRTPFLGDQAQADWTRYTIDTSAVNGFIHDTMIDARRSRDGASSNDVWKLTRNTRAVSVPRLFSELRAGLEDKVDGYYAHVRWLKEQIRYHDDRCGWRFWHCIEAGYYRGLLLGYKVFVGLPVQYVEAWVQDINRGLRAWPAASTQVARALFMQLDHKANLTDARNALSAYSSQYLCSMMGAPDAYCTLSSLVEDFIRLITFKLDLFRELKQRILDYAVTKATGHDVAYWKARLDPEPYLVNQEVAANPAGPTSTQQLDELMGAPNTPEGRFDMYRFAPAYNTYAAIKMSFLDNWGQWSSVINTVGVWNTNLGAKMVEYDAPHGFNGQVMLGFMRSMDWDNQWATPDRAFVSQSCLLHNQLFMQQTGDLHDPTDDVNERNRRALKLQAWCGGTQRLFYFAVNTNNATVNTRTHKIRLAGGETLSLGTCGVPGASGSGNTLLRLFSPSGTEVVANDDACGGRSSHFTYTAPLWAPGDYELRAGCAGTLAFCGGTVTWTIGGTFSYSQSQTNSATTRFTARNLPRLVEGQRLQLGTCGVAGASGSGDTYLRLTSSGGTQVAFNDDGCAGTLSYVHHVIPWGKSGDYQARAGCYANQSCSGTVAYLLSEAYPN
ncbi:zinc dependent phospholipase C family protein [Melittangium boletus]|uniref:zinc dependent phospholipase C family protein n=1 Tax=Melittangium boletus TaxID=83453 RepID=UPI003DA53508